MAAKQTVHIGAVEAIQDAWTSPRRCSLARLIRRRSNPRPPDLGISPQVQHGDHDDRFVHRLKVDRVRKRMEQCSPHIITRGRELEWPLTDVSKRMIDIAQKAARETLMLFLVPSRGIVEIGLGERPNDEPARH